MRDLCVRLQIDIFPIERHPFSIRRRHRGADAFELHHVFEGEWMFAAGDTGPWCLRKKQSCERETECDKNFHLAVKLPPNLRTCHAYCPANHRLHVAGKLPATTGWQPVLPRSPRAISPD